MNKTLPVAAVPMMMMVVLARIVVAIDRGSDFAYRRVVLLE